MSVEMLAALALFSLVSAITPGPNNLMVLASGVNFGFAQSLPHMAGVLIGFVVLMACVGFGLGQLLVASPSVFAFLKMAGAAYMIYLAWRVAISGPVGRSVAAGRPLTFLQAAAFQWVNPKGWAMSVTAMAVFTRVESYAASVALVILVFALVTPPSLSIWCGMGTGLRRWLNDPRRLRLFNCTMAVLLVASLWPMLR